MPGTVLRAVGSGIIEQVHETDQSSGIYIELIII
jgi:hypothetical protein